MTCHFLLGKWDDISFFNQNFVNLKRLNYPYDVSACKWKLTDWWTAKVFCQLKVYE